MSNRRRATKVGTQCQL